jgi:transcriptional regulator
MPDKQEAITFMQKYSFATLVTVATGVPSATHLPFVVEQREGKVVLISHLAKANPQADELLNGKALVIFAEPHAYISPKHYEHEKNVPTWNYIAVHAYGTISLIEGAELKAALLEQTINFYEAAYLQQWQAMPDDYKLNMMKGIVGFEIVVDDLQGKKKLSQNRSETERENIITELSESQDSAGRDIAANMRSIESK